MEDKKMELSPLRQWLQPKSHVIVGIDISPLAVRIMEFSHDSQLHLKHYTREILPLNSSKAPSIENKIALTEIIKKWSSTLIALPKYLRMSIPESLVISKVIQVSPHFSEEEIEEFILNDITQSISSLEEINFDFKILGPSVHDDMLLDTLVVVSRKEQIANYIAPIVEAGLEVSALDINTYAVARAAQSIWQYLSIPCGEKNAIFHLDAIHSFLIVADLSKLLYSREEAIGVMSLLGRLALHHHISLSEAFILKEDNLDPATRAIIKKFQDELLLAIKKALYFFYLQNPDIILSHLMLSGELAGLTTLADWLEEQLRIKIWVANPLLCLAPTNKQHDQALKDTSSLMVSYGLALRTTD